MQETLKQLTTVMPSSGLNLVFGEESKDLSSSDLEGYISQFLDKEVTWIDLSSVGEGGLHLIAKAVGCDAHKINRQRYITQFMNELVELIGMTKRDNPRTYKVGNIPGQTGITSFVPLIESHASFHSTPEESYFDFDVYSCKPFNVSRALAFTMNYFDVSEFQKLQIMER